MAAATLDALCPSPTFGAMNHGTEKSGLILRMLKLIHDMISNGALTTSKAGFIPF
jgi:hypothetical protein